MIGTKPGRAKPMKGRLPWMEGTVRFVAYTHFNADVPLKKLDTLEVTVRQAYTSDRRHYRAEVMQFIDRHTAFGNLVTRETVK